MSDLISRAAAIEYLMTNMGWHDEDGYEVDDADEKRKVITDLVNGIPAVDAVPVVHGLWLGRRYDFKEYKYVIVPYDVTTFDNPDNLFCSVCNTPALSNGAENDVPSNYCPYCGAKMDSRLTIHY